MRCIGFYPERRLGHESASCRAAGVPLCRAIGGCGKQLECQAIMCRETRSSLQGEPSWPSLALKATALVCDSLNRVVRNVDAMSALTGQVGIDCCAVHLDFSRALKACNDAAPPSLILFQPQL